MLPAYLAVPKGTTSKIVELFIENSGSPGTGLTGLTFASAGLTCYYIRAGDTAMTAVTLATATIGTFASGGFKELDSTHGPGLYEMGIPNALLATGANSVTIYLQGAASMFPLTFTLELTSTSNQDAVRGGMTALPNANAAATGGLIINGTNAGSITVSSISVGALAVTAGMTVVASAGGSAVTLAGNGGGSGLAVVGGATGSGFRIAGGSTSGAGINITTTIGSGIVSTPTSGDALTLTGPVTLSSTLSTGAVTLSALTVTNNLIVSGDTAFQGDAGIVGNFSIGGTVEIGSEVTLDGSLTISQFLDLNGLSNGGITTFTGAVTATNASNNLTGIHADIIANGIGTSSMATDSLSAAAVSAAAVTKIQGSLSTLTQADVRTAVGMASANLDTQLAALQSDTDNIQTRIPTALVSGRIDASVGAMAANTVTASAVATDAVTEIAAGVDTTLTSSHGAGLWTKSSSSGSGAFIVTVTVIDDFSAVVPGANVRLTQGVNEYVAQANASGVASFSLDAATYQRSITKSGYTFTPDSIVVSASADFGAVMIRIVFPGPPSDPSMCTIFGYLVNVSTGLPANYVALTATLSPDVPSYAGGILIGNQRSAASNQAGFVSLDVIKNSAITPAGSQWVIRCVPAGISSPQTLTTDTFNVATVITG